MDAAREALDKELHRALSLPPHAGEVTAAKYAREMAGLSPSQRESLDADPSFQQALRALREAGQNLVRAKQALFENDPRWREAKQAASRAENKKRGADRNIVRDARGSSVPRRERNTAQDLAAQARLTIAAGKTVLRQLGAAPWQDETGPSSN